MSDQFRQFFDIIIVILLMFLIPTYYHIMITDSDIGIYVTHEVNIFGDQICKDGYLSQEMYESLLTKLSNTNILYDIEMVHEHDVYYPTDVGDASLQTFTTYTTDIRNMLFPIPYQSLTNYDKGDYISCDGILYEFLGDSNIFPYNPSLITDYDTATGISILYPYWRRTNGSVDGKYLMQRGDRFSIKVTNRKDTTSQRISHLLGFGGSSGIHAYGGGMVTDENY